MDNREAIETFELQNVVIPDPNAISHNKFIILLKKGKPIQVWTGSTNMTEGGIFCYSNVGHIVRDPKVAAQYLKYCKKLSGDPAMSRRIADDQIRPWNDENSPVPDDAPPRKSTIAIFKPTRIVNGAGMVCASDGQGTDICFSNRGIRSYRCF